VRRQCIRLPRTTIAVMGTLYHPRFCKADIRLDYSGCHTKNCGDISLSFRSSWGFDIFIGLSASAFWNFAILSCYIIFHLHAVLSWFGLFRSFLLGYNMLDSFSIRLPPLRLTGYTYRTSSLLYVDPFFLGLQCTFLWVFILNLQLHRECRLRNISRFPFAYAVTINHLPSLLLAYTICFGFVSCVCVCLYEFLCL